MLKLTSFWGKKPLQVNLANLVGKTTERHFLQSKLQHQNSLI